jgi:hypothetical protein
MQLTDLFIVGLACDIVGAYLLASSIVRPRDVIISNFHSMGGGRDFRDLAAEYADGRLGITSLLSGFTIQGAGYLLSLGGWHARSTGTQQVVIALILCGATVLLLFAARAVLRPRLMLNLAKALALGRPKADRDGAQLAQELWYMMIGADLVGYGQALGYSPRNLSETQQDRRTYIKRVFDLDLPPDADRLQWPPQEDNLR